MYTHIHMYGCVCVLLHKHVHSMHMHATPTHMAKKTTCRNRLPPSILWVPGDQSLVIRLVDKHLCPLSHFSSPSDCLYKRPILESRPHSLKGVEYVVHANSNKEEDNDTIHMSSETKRNGHSVMTEGLKDTVIMIHMQPTSEHFHGSSPEVRD